MFFFTFYYLFRLIFPVFTDVSGRILCICRPALLLLRYHEFMHEKPRSFLTFFLIDFLFNMAANFAHPVTPTLIVERGLDASLFGVAFAAMMAMYFLFSPLWGRLCDYLPVKRILLICCLGYGSGQIVFGLAQNETAVILGRMLAGGLAGGIYVAHANYVINLCKEDKERQGSLLITLVTIQNVGGAIGYFVGGMLGLISVETAFLVQVAVVTASGLLWFFTCLDDTPYKEIPEHPLRLKDINPFAAIMDARKFMTPLLALIFAVTAVSSLGQYSYEQCFNYYLKDQYGLSSAYNGIFKALIAFLTLLLNSTVSRYLQRKTDINKTFVYILIACTFLTGLILIDHSQILFIAVYIVYSSVMVLRLPLLQILASAHSDPSSSNSVMGFYQAMTSFGGIFGALFAGLIYARGAMLPFVFAFASYLISTLLAFVYRKQLHTSVK